MSSDKLFTKVGVLFASLFTVLGAEASLDLLAGVEAGIDTRTAMTSTDLAKTQQILSTETVGKPHVWVNPDTGIQYQILIDHHYSYGHYPCLAYQLTIIQPDNSEETKSLDTCKNSNDLWISITAGSSAL